MAMPSILAGLWGLASAWRVLTTGKHPSSEVSSALTVPNNALRWISGWNDSAQSLFSTSKEGYRVFKMPAPPSVFWKGAGGGGHERCGGCCRDRDWVDGPSCTTFWYWQSVFHKCKKSLSVPALYIWFLGFRTSTQFFLWALPCAYVWFVVSLCLNCRRFRAAIMHVSISVLTRNLHDRLA